MGIFSAPRHHIYVLVVHWLLLLWIFLWGWSNRSASVLLNAQQREVKMISEEFKEANTLLLNTIAEVSAMDGGAMVTAAPTVASQSGALSPLSPVAPQSCPSPGNPWLVVGIPSVARPGQDYLSGMIKSYEKQLPTDPSHPMYGKVRIVIMNNTKDKTHPAFYENKARLQNSAVGSHFVFLEHPNPGTELNAPQEPFNANKPNAKVRQQTRDVITLLRSEAVAASNARYFLFSEDDMNLCDNGFRAIDYMVQKATLYGGDWTAIRASYGLCGVVLQMKDVPTIANYYEEHISRRPPDHLMVEWFGRETDQSRQYFGNRINMAFRWNIFDHKGVVSSLRPFKQATFPKCYEFLGEPTNFAVESFSTTQCPDDDMWPCAGYSGEKSMRLFFATTNAKP